MKVSSSSPSPHKRWLYGLVVFPLKHTEIKDPYWMILFPVTWYAVPKKPTFWLHYLSPKRITSMSKSFLLHIFEVVLHLILFLYTILLRVWMPLWDVIWLTAVVWFGSGATGSWYYSIIFYIIICFK